MDWEIRVIGNGSVGPVQDRKGNRYEPQRDGTLEGIVLLSLDHRHLMELTLHILPTEARFVVFPSYSSGNYAFMFDDGGWIISHPKFYDIRGLRPDGSGFDPHAPDYTRERLLAGEVPFNLDFVSFINPNYPLIAREVRQGRSGVTSTFNVGAFHESWLMRPFPTIGPPMTGTMFSEGSPSASKR